jgi:hypothetical protein
MLIQYFYIQVTLYCFLLVFRFLHTHLKKIDFLSCGGYLISAELYKSFLQFASLVGMAYKTELYSFLGLKFLHIYKKRMKNSI